MFEPARLLEHVLSEDASKSPAAAIELTWWKRWALIALAKASAFATPSMFALIGGEIVDRRETEEMVDFSLKPARILRRDAETAL
jgi:hypothetical protein